MGQVADRDERLPGGVDDRQQQRVLLRRRGHMHTSSVTPARSARALPTTYAMPWHSDAMTPSRMMTVSTFLRHLILDASGIPRYLRASE